MLRAIEAINVRTVPLIEPAILYFHRRARERAAREDAAVLMAEAMSSRL